MAGVGKTTLARGLVEWLAATEGLGEGCFWFTFNDIRSSEYVFNQMVEPLFGAHAMAADLAQKQALLVEAFKKRRFILVWDNFESATGIPGTPLEARLPELDRQWLWAFLGKLRGGASKVIITSRSPEAWLGSDRCFPLSLGGLQGEERWEYCATILRDLGLDADQQDAELKTLMELLDGHPLAMRVLLPRLEKVSAYTLISKLRGQLNESNSANCSIQVQLQGRLFTVLDFVVDSLPLELKPLLIFLVYYDRFLHLLALEMIAKQAGCQCGRVEIEKFLYILVGAGLLRLLDEGMYEMHSALKDFLRFRFLENDTNNASSKGTWQHSLTELMELLANKLTRKEIIS
ncbi:MAG: hypothetical protein HC889_05425 [Synechococcaceae cyanobacterium SM1_2_3]|nr:hypothetical protein [Synechococcaceae cyanobacterium SM1_2_3]